MSNVLKIAWLALAVLAEFDPAAAASRCEMHEDGAGNRVSVHPRSFADKAVCPGPSFCANHVFHIDGLKNDPANVEGPPTYLRGPRGKRAGRGIYSLGCRGSAIFAFEDNRITDVPGPDIFVFEVGRAKESTLVEISVDGEAWLNVGEIGGAKASIDISGVADPGQGYRFVRLTDLGTSCGNRTAGADIDAIATYGYSWVQIEDDTSVVFFDTGRFELRDQAKDTLRSSFRGYVDIDKYRLRITGHTDSVGADADNLELSRRRAEAVARFLITEGFVSEAALEASGAGEALPVDSNDTLRGRARNRRVELLFLPLGACP